MALYEIKLSEKSQSQKVTDCMIPFYNIFEGTKL